MIFLCTTCFSAFPVSPETVLTVTSNIYRRKQSRRSLPAQCQHSSLMFWLHRRRACCSEVLFTNVPQQQRQKQWHIQSPPSNLECVCQSHATVGRMTSSSVRERFVVKAPPRREKKKTLDVSSGGRFSMRKLVSMTRIKWHNGGSSSRDIYFVSSWEKCFLGHVCLLNQRHCLSIFPFLSAGIFFSTNSAATQLQKHWFIWL